MKRLTSAVDNSGSQGGSGERWPNVNDARCGARRSCVAVHRPHGAGSSGQSSPVFTAHARAGRVRVSRFAFDRAGDAFPVPAERPFSCTIDHYRRRRRPITRRPRRRPGHRGRGRRASYSPDLKRPAQWRPRSQRCCPGIASWSGIGRIAVGMAHQGFDPSTDPVRRARLAGDVLHDRHGALADERDGHCVQRAALVALRGADDETDARRVPLPSLAKPTQACASPNSY